MSTHRNLITLCAAAVLTLGLAACGGGGDGQPEMTMPVDPTPTPDPEPTELEKAQTAAAQAAMDAMTAAGNAETSADNADDARMNAATIQTGQMSGDLAMKAREQADMANDAYMDAKAASEAAAAATTVTAAVKAQSDAEDARDTAQDAETMAGDYAQQSMDAAGMELMIVGTMKSVGDTMIDATAPNQVVTTTAGGKTTVADTGLQGELMEEATGAVTPGVAFVSDTDPATPHTAYVQQVAARDITIGKTVDSADDSARLAIVTSYAGSKTVKVFSYAEAAPDVTTTADGRTGTVMGKVTLDDGDADTTDTNNTSLRSVGMYYLAGAAADTDGLGAADEVAADAKATQVYAYVDLGDDNARGGTGADADTTVYLVSDGERTEDGTTTYIYRSVDVMAAAADADNDGTAEEVQVTAKIPDATDYEHIHFGVWASLNATGTAASGIGIGFVQNFAGAATEASDMPNHGSATYDGNWVATIQAIDEEGNGAVTLEDGVAMMTADFEKNTVEAMLTGLATLSGTIDGNTFSGTGLSDITHGSLSSDEDDFTGSTSGGFFGARAAEAGGVFSFTSDGNEDGAFSGAFGGSR